MKRSFFQATAIVVASGLVLPLLARPARADDSLFLRCASSVDRCARATTQTLYGGWIDRKPLWYIITDASDLSGASKVGAVYSPDPASAGNGARQAAQLGDRYVFEGGDNLSRQRSYEVSTGGFPPESFNPHSVGDRYSPFVRVGGIAGALNTPTFAPDGERPYAQKGYSPLLNMQVLPADNAPRFTDFALFAQGANPAGFLVNYADVVRIIRL